MMMIWANTCRSIFHYFLLILTWYGSCLWNVWVLSKLKAQFQRKENCFKVHCRGFLHELMPLVLCGLWAETGKNKATNS